MIHNQMINNQMINIQVIFNNYHMLIVVKNQEYHWSQ